MRFTGAMSASMVLLGFVHIAEAAPPKVQGKYATISYHICQTVFLAPKVTVDKNNNPNSVSVVGSFGPLWTAGANTAGLISVTVGTINFPATPTSSGSATGNDVEVGGHAHRFPHTGVLTDASGLVRMTHTGNGNFTFTATTATIGGKIYDMTFGNVQSNGVANTINLLRRPSANEHCLDTKTLTRQ